MLQRGMISAKYWSKLVGQLGREQLRPPVAKNATHASAPAKPVQQPAGPRPAATPTGNPSAAEDQPLFEQAPAGYMLLNAAGCFERINRAGVRILGWDSAWLTGKPFARWVFNNDKPLFLSHLHRVQEERACQVSQVLRVKNRQGRPLAVRLHSAPVATRDGATAGLRSIMLDVSGDVHSAQELRQLQAQVAHASRMGVAGELAASVAHDLNQPLGTVMLNCETALRLLDASDAGEAELAQALSQATEAASYAGEIVRHLRVFFSNKEQVHSVCHVSDLIDGVWGLIAAQARDHEIGLERRVDADLPDVRADPVQIEQVLLNLVTNAIEAMAGDPARASRLAVNAERAGCHWIRLTVADTGPGMNAAAQRQLFTPFYTTKHDGMGLGLCICQSIIEAHGGQLQVDSGPDRGTVMALVLPAISRAQDYYG